MNELEPCPFCGFEPWGCFGPLPEDGSGWAGCCWVECHSDRTGNENTICGDWFYTGTREETIAAWNRRAPKGEPAAWMRHRLMTGDGGLGGGVVCEFSEHPFRDEMGGDVEALYTK